MQETTTDRRATLDELAILNGTDKGSRHPVKGHDYCRHYEKHFATFRDSSIKFLEVGVGGGESIITWLDYFPNAKICGIDKVNSTNPWNTVKAPTHPRYTFVTGDQSDQTFWKCFEADYGSNWDVIIDDGSHMARDVLEMFQHTWRLIRPGGLYCVEDLGVAYTPGSVFISPGANHADWQTGLVSSLHTRTSSCEEIHFYPELMIIRKEGEI